MNSKKITFLIVGGSILVTLIVLLIISLQHNTHVTVTPVNPQPTERNASEKEGRENDLSREAFFAQMHAAAPGTNWWKMDLDLRYEKMLERKNYNAYRSMQTTDGDEDTVGNGHMTGTWYERGSYNTSGRIWATDIDFPDNAIYAFSDGGNLWKGDPDGSNWAVLNDNFKLTGVQKLRKTGDRLIVIPSQWDAPLYFTEDEGLSWTASTGLENMENWGYIFDSEILNDAEHTIYLLVYEWDYTDWWDIVSLYRSTDLGNSFSKITSWDVPTFGSTDKFSIWAPRYGDSTCYLVENSDFYALDNASMPQFTGSLPYDNAGDLILCGFDNGTERHLYLSNYVPDDGQTYFYSSDDNGVNWNSEGSVSEGHFSKTSFYCSQLHPGYLFYGGVDVHRSVDAGANWNIINEWYDYYGNPEHRLHADITYIESFLDPAGTETLLISTDGGLFKSSDAGLSVENLTLTGMRNAQYYDVYTYRPVPDILFAGAQDQGYQRSTDNEDGKYYFDQLYSGDYGHLVSQDGGDYLWMVYPGFVLLSYDASATNAMFTWDFVGDNHLWMAPVMEDPDDPAVAWWGGSSESGGAYLWKLNFTGAGINGIKQTFDFSDGASISAMAYSPLNHNQWYVILSDGKFFHSEDRGLNWTQSAGFTGPGPQYFYGAVILPSRTDADEVFVGGSGYSNPPVYKSVNHGINFTSMSLGLPSTLVYDMASSPDDSFLFAATEVAPYVYVKSENHWYDMSAGKAPLQTYWSVDYVDALHAARFGTYGRGTWEFARDIPSTSVPALAENNACNIFPNPAAHEVQISLDAFIPNADIAVFNLRGQCVLRKTHAAFNRDIPYHLALDDLQNGNYILSVSGNNRHYSTELSVVH